MAQENINPYNNEITNGENEIPLTIRTAESDVKSLGQTGGQIPQPYTPPTNQVNQQPPQQQDTSNQTQANFEPPQIGDVITTNNAPSPKQQPPIPKKQNLLPIIIIILIIIGLIAFGALFIYPKIMYKNSNNVSNPTSTTNSTITATTTTSTDTINQISTSTINLNLPTIDNHNSFFKQSPDKTITVTINSTNVNDFKKLFTFSTSSTPILQEIIITDPNKKIISFQGLMSMLIPTFFNQDRLNYFNQDYTFYAYTDANGTWLGIIPQLKSGVSAANIMNQMSQIQTDVNEIQNLYLTNVGQMHSWQDGKVKNHPTSLVNFDTSSATFSYTWLNNYLLLSTNLNSADSAATHLGF
ncbi:MAG: hypothetical protein ACP5IC_00555 [Minisyncoccia bacterium]